MQSQLSRSRRFSSDVESLLERVSDAHGRILEPRSTADQIGPSGLDPFATNSMGRPGSPSPLENIRWKQAGGAWDQKAQHGGDTTQQLWYPRRVSYVRGRLVLSQLSTKNGNRQPKVRCFPALLFSIISCLLEVSGASPGRNWSMQHVAPCCRASVLMLAKREGTIHSYGPQESCLEVIINRGLSNGAVSILPLGSAKC